MIEHIEVENILLIKHASIDFTNNLNIVSGETGAGKSMLLNSINYAFGEKSGTGIIRKGENYASVTVTISVNEYMRKLLADFDITPDEEGKIIIYRTVNLNGKSSARINGKVASITVLKSIKDMFIDFHSQNKNVAMLAEENHIQLLDKFCSPKLNEYKDKLKEILDEYRDNKRKINELTGGLKDCATRIDIIDFQIEEIESVELYDGIDVELKMRKDFLTNIGKIKNTADSIYSLLASDENYDVGIITLLGDLQDKLYTLSDYDEHSDELKEMCESTVTANSIMEDVKKSIRLYKDSIDVDGEELNKITETLETINKLKKKYGDTIEEILQFKSKIEKERAVLENSEQYIEDLNKSQKKLLEKINFSCSKISEERKKGKDVISKNIETIFSDINMKDAKFDVSIEKSKEVTNNGYDKVVFKMITNKGDVFESISKKVSGGEMSRIMFALKMLFANVNNIDTFVFDEIDTGVSGRTAQKLANKIKQFSAKYQVICITHLPQIASMADTHFLISKCSDSDETTTTIHQLDEESSIKEISRLLGGLKITEQTVNASREMKNLARDFSIN